MSPELSAAPPMKVPHLAIDVTHRLGTLRLATSFQASSPWTILFGPSGSGKSTILRTIAGLVRPDHGCVSVLGQVVADTQTGTWVKPHLRRIRWAGQRPALFPRKTVRDNLALATGSGDSIDLLQRALTLFDLEPLVDKHPAQLSGGERQRVSVVRAAIGARGRVLLLDEPFAGLDAAIRDQLIGSLRLWLEGSPVISVTHDVGEAFLLNAEIIRIANGSVMAQGPVDTVLADERTSLQSILR